MGKTKMTPAALQGSSWQFRERDNSRQYSTVAAKVMNCDDFFFFTFCFTVRSRRRVTQCARATFYYFFFQSTDQSDKSFNLRKRKERVTLISVVLTQPQPPPVPHFKNKWTLWWAVDPSAAPSPPTGVWTKPSTGGAISTVDLNSSSTWEIFCRSTCAFFFFFLLRRCRVVCCIRVALLSWRSCLKPIFLKILNLSFQSPVRQLCVRK